jgi:pimeloyl-ACP methyl ester carboxylesterase
MDAHTWTRVPDNSGALSIGAGPPVLLAHGAGGGVKGNFSALAAEMCDSRRLIGMDYPGSGNRPMANRPLRVEALADDLVAAGDAAGLTRFPIVGLSLGGAVAVAAAARHPDRVSGLVLTAGFPYADAQLRDNIALFDALGSSPDPLSRARLIFQSCFSPAMMNGMSQQDHEDTLASLAATIPAGATDQYRLSDELDISASAASVRVPTLVIVAGQDRMVLPSTTRRFVDLIPGAELREYPTAGHAFVGGDVQDWARDISRFLTRNGL